MIITVVTPSYNQGRYLAETIESVLSQEGDFYLDYIIVDGASSDGSVEIIKRYDSDLNSGKRPVSCRGITYRWISEKDKGQTDAIAKGFRMAEGEILAWLNSDDTYTSGALSKAASMFEAEPDISLLYGKGYYIESGGEIVGIYPTGPFDDKLLAMTNFICQPSTFFRKSSFVAAGGLDTDLRYAMDYDLWIRMGRRFRLSYLPEFLSRYRLHEESKTFSRREALANHREVLHTALKYYHWAPLNRVYGYCYHLVKSKMPSRITHFTLFTIILSLPFAIARYMIMNRGIRIDDLKMITAGNMKKLLAGQTGEP